MSDEDRGPARRRYVDELPRVDIGRPDQWPPSFVQPATHTTRAGWTTSQGLRTRVSWSCPGCGCGARSLWLDEGRWVCRHCADLTHRCRHQSPATRAALRARKIRRELGASDALYTPVPPPPPELALSTDPARGLQEYDDLVDDLTRSEFESLAFRDRDLRELRGY